MILLSNLNYSKKMIICFLYIQNILYDNFISKTKPFGKLYTHYDELRSKYLHVSEYIEKRVDFRNMGLYNVINPNY